MNDYRESIQRILSKLGPKSRKIAELALNDPIRFVSCSTSRLAEYAGCDKTTVVHLARQLGFSGFTEFRMAAARANGEFWSEAKTDSTPVRRPESPLLERLARAHAAAVEKTLAGLSMKTLNDICGKLENAGRIMAFGSGMSHLAARDLGVKLNRLGAVCTVYEDFELTKTFVGYLREDGVLILFSQSGENANVLELARMAENEKIPVVGITSETESELARRSWRVIRTEHSDPAIRFGAMSGRSAQLAAADAISLFYSLDDRERSWHFIEKGYYEND